ncbi:MAG: DUF1015 family protein [Verrucomicrobiota bacterium]
MRVKAFQGLVPHPDKVSQIASVPYDGVNTAEARELAAGNPLSFLHVLRAEIDLPDGTDPYSDEVYANSVANFQQLQDEGGLVRESAPSVYLYRQTMGEHSQIGIALTCHIDDYENDIIRKHEKTRQQKEDDRTRVVNDLSANPGPVFLTYRESSEIDTLVEKITTSHSPVHDFVAPDGVGHTVWKVEGGSEFERLFGEVPLGYVADGHHRSASAWRVGAERRAANADHTGDENYNWFLCVLFPANQLKILAYNRAVSSLNGHTPQQLLDAIGENFTVEETTDKEPSAPGSVCMYLDGKWYSVRWTPDQNADPVSSLDVSVLQERLLAPLLGVDDPRTADNIEFIGGIRGTDELESKVNSGAAAVAFSMYPVTCDQLMAIADAGQIMPPKSTWFEPKLRSGLFVHTLD